MAIRVLLYNAQGHFCKRPILQIQPRACLSIKNGRPCCYY